MNPSPEAELMNELTNISNSITPYNQNNKFKSMVYNFAPKGHQVRMLQESRLQPIDDTNQYYQVDSSLFNEALSKNPDPDRLYPWQLNSCYHLSERLNLDSNTIHMFGESLDKMENSLREIENNFNIKTSERIKKISEGQSKLLERLCVTRQKLERYLDSKKALSRDSGQEMKLISKIEQIKKRLEIKNKIEKLNPTQMQNIKGFKIPEEKIEDILKVLQEQRAGIADLRKLVMDDISKVQKIEEVIGKSKNKIP
jgi:anion-transporting  ArsA/GET3 family ATPase